MSICLGIDYGTSSLKALLWDTDSCSVLGVSSEEIPYVVKDGKRAEQDPKTVLDRAFVSTGRLLSKAGIQGQEIQGVSFSGQMHGLIGIDSQMRPLTRIITWEDGRGTDSTIESAKEIAPTLLEKSGCGFARGYLGVTALALMKEEKPLFSKVNSLLLPGDWLRNVFGSRKTPFTDPSNGSSSGLFHTEARDWNWEAISSLGFRESLFPEVVESSVQVDVVSRETAEKTGLKEGTPLFVGGGDQPLSMLGSGIAKQDGSLLLNVGTGSQVSMRSQTPVKNERLATFCFPEAGYSVLGAGLSGGAAFRWIRDLLREGFEQLEGDAEDNVGYGPLCDLAETVPPGAAGLLFLPLLSGARHAPASSGSFTGLRSHHRLGHIVRAVLEGVIWELKMFALGFPERTSPPSALVGAGGGLANPLWARIAASIFGGSLGRSACSQQAALGAALLAAVGLGDYSSLEEGASHVPMDQEKILPVWTEAYAELVPRVESFFNRAFEV